MANNVAPPGAGTNLVVPPLDLPPRPDGEPLVAAVWADKGGVGKTTWASHLAYELGAQGYGPVLLIDTNVHQQRSSSTAVFTRLKVDPPYACTQEAEPRNLARVRGIRAYRRIVIDLPPSPDEAAAGLAQADVVIVPALQEFLAFQGVMETIQLLQQYVAQGGGQTVILLNRTGHNRGDRPTAAVQQIQDGLTAMGVRFMVSTGRAYGAHQHAQAHGVPLTHSPGLYDRGDKAAADVRAVVAEFVAMTRMERSA